MKATFWDMIKRSLQCPFPVHLIGGYADLAFVDGEERQNLILAISGDLEVGAFFLKKKTKKKIKIHV